MRIAQPAIGDRVTFHAADSELVHLYPATVTDVGDELVDLEVQLADGQTAPALGVRRLPLDGKNRYRTWSPAAPLL